MKRSFRAAPLWFVSLLLIIVELLPAASPKAVATILDGKKQVFVTRGAREFIAHKGVALAAGDRVRTTSGDCLVAFPSLGIKIRLAAESQGGLSDAGNTDGAVFQFFSGKMWMQKRGDVPSVIVAGKTALKSVEGEFFVDIHAYDSVKLAVRSGSVEIAAPRGAVVAGPMTEVYADDRDPPVVRGLEPDEILLWNEPFERY